MTDGQHHVTTEGTTLNWTRTRQTVSPRQHDVGIIGEETIELYRRDIDRVQSGSWLRNERLSFGDRRRMVRLI
jgi:hypothetical protein